LKCGLIVVPAVGYVLYKVCRFIRRYRQMPPGPTGIPWLGYTPCLGKFRLPSLIVPILTGNNAFNELQKLHAEYGPTVSFRLCGHLIVVFSNMEGIRSAALDCRSWIGRHTMLTNHLLAGGRGISNYDGDNAISLRRSLVRAIHSLLPSKVNMRELQSDFALAKSLEATEQLLKSYADIQLDSKLDMECSKLINLLNTKAGEPVPVNPLIRRLVWLVVWRAVFGFECTLSDAEITELMQNVADNNSVNGPFQFKQMLPLQCSFILANSTLARRIAGVDDIWRRYNRVTDVLRETVDKAIREQKLPSNCLLAQVMGSQGTKFVPSELHRLAFELMAAGVDTTTLTIMWACHAIATGRLQVRPREKFTQAHLNAVHRMASVVPLALPHTARYDNIVCGYFVPKGSIIFFNLFALHQNQLQALEASTLGCPFSKPAVNKRTECPLPFSLGSRACPGFMFATRLILRVMTHLLSHFKIEIDKEAECAGTKQAGLTRPPTTQRYKFQPI
uniref:Cytochrome P450 n=1 Tax=Schistocephalus solidus TaxID=70667 RepID=A0A183TCM8_SCHSO